MYSPLGQTVFVNPRRGHAYLCRPKPGPLEELDEPDHNPFWILEAGAWSDGGYWDDRDVWHDHPTD